MDSGMTTITITLDDERLARFQESARVLGIAPEDLARRSIEEFLDRPNPEFDQIITEILTEHGEVLRRLAR